MHIVRLDAGNFSHSSGTDELGWELGGLQQTLSPGETIVGTVYTKVKETLSPLDRLYLELDMNGKRVKSLPIVYGVFPEVNLTQQLASGKGNV